jgi:hypothetical protein
MPAWPGGACPECGDDMPPNLVHCQVCRALLNRGLERPPIMIPEFVPLREIDPNEVVQDDTQHITPNGYMVSCPECCQELKIGENYVESTVACKHCNHAFVMSPYNHDLAVKGIVSTCPQCSNRLKISAKYVGLKVLCNFCNTSLVVDANKFPHPNLSMNNINELH